MAGQGLLLKTFNYVNSWMLSASRVNAVFVPHVVRTLTLATKERLKTLNIPEKPKRPLSPYFQFLTEKRNIIVKENPKLSPTEIVKKLAADWRTVSVQQKTILNDKFRAEMDIYNTKIVKYNADLTEEQREALHAADTEKRNDRKKRQLTKLKKENNKPRRPAGPYLLYLREQSKIRNVPQNVLVGSLKDEWMHLPDNEKQRYKDQYVIAWKEYQVELGDWERKMAADGHPELIRSKTKIDQPFKSRILEAQEKKSRPQ